jgi:Tol biopolymer transport system component
VRRAHLTLATLGAASGCAAALLGASCGDGSLSAQQRQQLRGTLFYVSEASGAAKTHQITLGAAAVAARPLIATSTTPDFPYGVTADRSALAVVRGQDGEHEIVLVALRGDRPAARVVADGAGIDGSPAFSPDGQWILFESARDSFRELYKMPVSGGDVVRLTDNPEGNFDGAWSPDGRRIAFASSRHGQLDLFVMAADGSGQARLTHHPGDSIKPAWSPSGEWIAFVSGRDGRDGIYVVRPDGSALTNLSGDRAVEERFAWRPDGRAIAYVALERSGKKKIRVVELATRTDRALSGGAHDDFDPAWSPDGAHLAFASQERRGHPDLWIMRADGQRRTRITHDPVGAWLPRWIDVGP